MRITRVRAVMGMVGVAGLTLVGVTATATAAPSTTLVVSEAYGGGGNSGAPLTNDFVELQSLGSGGTSLSGYSVQYISASPGATTTWQVTPLSGTVAAGKHYLVQEAAGSTPAAALPMRSFRWRVCARRCRAKMSTVLLSSGMA